MQINGAVVSHLTTRLLQWFAIWNPEICSLYFAVCSKFCCSYCHQDCSEGTPVLKELHWLPVDRRIEYKILLYAYKVLNGLAPEYLCDMVESYAPDRVLRSASQNLLVVPRGKHCQYSIRTFAKAAATLWNSLNVRDRGNRTGGSPSLESFKSNLKTLLFKEHFYPFSS